MMNEYTLNDIEYGQVLDNVVVACVDIAIIHGDKILLEKRRNNPIKNEWWLLGGRMKVREDLQATAKRNLFEDLGIDVTDSKRFIQIGTFNLRWPLRREPDTNNGCHHLLIAHLIELTDSEKQFVNDHLSQLKIHVAWTDIDEPSVALLPEMQDILSTIKALRSAR